MEGFARRPIDGLTIEEINRIVASVFLTTPEETKEKTRKREVVKPRQCSMMLMYRYTSDSLTGIGDYFHKDRVTVRHGILITLNLVDTKDKYFYPKIKEATKLVACKRKYCNGNGN
jgi:chromosomal replication initiation ATPase DnaA